MAAIAVTAMTTNVAHVANVLTSSKVIAKHARNRHEIASFHPLTVAQCLYAKPVSELADVLADLPADLLLAR
jgi:hypothetical protein